MYFKDKNLLLCGLDHGFSTMKGTHVIFAIVVADFIL